MPSSARRPSTPPPRTSGGYTTTEYAVMAALVVVIGVSLCLGLYYGVVRDRPRRLSSPELRYRCDKCGAEFATPAPSEEAAAGDASAAPPPVDCPSCEAEQCAYRMIRCPVCMRYYVPEAYRRPAARQPGGLRLMCPDCEADRRKWSEQQKPQGR